MNKITRAKLINKAIADLIASKEELTFVSWKEIMDAVNAATAFQIKNWFEVRDVLQGFINRNELNRSKDLTVEQYLVMGV